MYSIKSYIQNHCDIFYYNSIHRKFHINTFKIESVDPSLNGASTIVTQIANPY
jgi:hypothetical protein